MVRIDPSLRWLWVVERFSLGNQAEEAECECRKPQLFERGVFLPVRLEMSATEILVGFELALEPAHRTEANGALQKALECGSLEVVIVEIIRR